MMPSLNTAIAGLTVSRQSVDNTSNNIANQNSTGFVKRELESGEIRTHGNIIGDGAKLENISRVFDRGMQTNIMNATSREQYFITEQEILSEVETVTRDIDNVGIYNDLIDFFSAMEDIKSEPSSKVYQNALQHSVDKMLFNIENLHNSIEVAEDKLSGDGFVVGEIDEDVAEVNRITSEITQLNKEIKESNDPPLGLYDKRDQLERDLSEHIDIMVVDDESYVIYVNDSRKQFLVHDVLNVPITYEQGDTDTRKELKINGEDLQSQYGSLRAKAENDHDGKLKQYKDELENLVRQLTRTVNEAYNTMSVEDYEAGFNKDSSTLTGEIEFKLDPYTYDSLDLEGKTLQEAVDDYNADATKSIDLKIDVETLADGSQRVSLIRENIDDEHSFFLYKDPAEIDPDTGKNYEFSFSMRVGANNTVLPEAMNELSKLQFQDDVDFGVDQNGYHVKTTIYRYYEQITIGMSGDLYNAEQKANVQADIITASKHTFENLVQVDLDNEMIDLMKYQAAYQANAKMITAVDEMIQTLLGLKS
jgi:flagellar hook-associated protein 1 FlgK